MEDVNLHYCYTLNRRNARNTFCRICGIKMDLENPFNLYHRSAKFKKKECSIDVN